jgi:CubicO group peptidase (beta-lactamase class C family)
MAYFPPSEANGGWRSLVSINATATAAQKARIKADAKLDWDKLKIARDYSDSRASGATILVIRNGWIGAEWGSTSALRVASISKSCTAVLIVDLIEAGKFSGLEAAIHQYLPASWGAADPRRKDIKIKHLLSMCSGIEPHDKPTQPNYLEVVLGQPVRVPPEAEWSYASLPVDLMSVAVRQVMGSHLASVFNSRIGRPLGIPALTWTTPFGGYTRASSGLQIRARDLARIGWMMLNNGAWGSGRVLSASNAALLRTRPSWLDGTTFRATPGSPFPVESNSADYYGLLWWLNVASKGLGSSVPTGAYYAHGFGESLLVVVPSRQLVVVRSSTGTFADPSFRREFMKRVMAAMV